ncbi:MAG: short-subunit dehydrogenase [Myxococcota bacterium]|jgi:short-subunit dehydrogenase
MPSALPQMAMLLVLFAALRWMPGWAFVVLGVLPLLAYGVWANRTRAHSLNGAFVVVTGASSGLGRALAHEAARRGASKVALLARRAERLDQVAAEIAGFAPTCTPIVVPCDLSDAESTAAAAAALERHHGSPDIVVNNAGAGAWEHIEETGPDSARQMMEVPTLAAIRLTHALVPAMAERGSGHVLTVTSAASMSALRGAVVYGTARWGMRGLAWNLRADLAEQGVGVTLLNAAEITDTEYFHDGDGRAGQASHSRLPMLFQHPLMESVSYSSAQTASAAWNAVEAGTFEALVPGFVLMPFDLLNRLFPDVVVALLALGPNGRRGF